MNKNNTKSQKIRKKAKNIKNDKEADEDDSKKEAVTSKLLDNAKHSLYTYEFDLALKFCQRALELEPENVEALDLQGSILTEMGDVLKAKKSLQRAQELEGKGNYSRLMSLGQLSVGSQAVQFYHSGIKAIQDAISQQKSEDAKDDVSTQMKDLSAAYLQLAEIYMTDECLNDEAEELCRTYLDQAIAADASNVQAFHTYASFYISLNSPQLAKEMMEKGLNMWLPRLREVHQSEAMSIEDDSLDVGCRVNCCKILIELQEYDRASEILEFLLDEDEQLVEVWYLLAWLNHLKGDGYQGNVKSYMKKAHELATTTDFEDEAMVEHMKEILAEVALVPEEEDDGGDDDDVNGGGGDDDDVNGGGGDDVNGGDEMDGSGDEKMEE